MVVFDAALREAGEHPARAHLLRGKGAALAEHAARVKPGEAEAILDSACESFEAAITVPAASPLDQALAQLGLARVLAGRDRQEEALKRFDEATALLTHIGAPMAGPLVQMRPRVAAGDWSGLAFA